MAEKQKTEKRKNDHLNERYVLVRPHISEKATDLATSNFYVFRVKNDAGKREVKHEVEKKYKVNVLKVRMIKTPSKKKSMGRKTEGERRGYKKAVVKIKEGQNIDLTA